MWKKTLLALLILCATSVTARAADVYGEPDYIHAVWLRVGFTTGGHFSYGLGLEALPLVAGVEISPHSEAGLFRAFAGMKSNFLTGASTRCSRFGGVGAQLVAAFGPGEAPQFGMRLGAHLRHMSMANDGQSTFPNDMPPATKAGEGISYNFSWLSRTHVLNDIGVELGAFRAPNSYCYGD